MLDRGSVVATERLIERLWGDEPPPSALGTLQAYVSNLRRALEPKRTAGAAPAVLVTRAPGYVLQIEPEQVDAVRFETLVHDAEAALEDGRVDEAGALLEAGRKLWRGPALAEVTYETFAQGEIGRLEELRLTATEMWAEVQLRLGRHAEVAAELAGLVLTHPLRSRLRGQLMLALYRSGRQADALRTYQEGRTVVREELGTEPDPELQQLEDDILVQSPSLDWRPTTVAAAPPSDPVAAGEETGAEAPVLIGRDAELAIVDKALVEAASGRGRVLLVAGEPGIGKTRLLDSAIARARGRRSLAGSGRSQEGEGAPAFWPWVQVLRDLLAQAGPVDLAATLGPSVRELLPLLPELQDRLDHVAPPADPNRFRVYDAVTRLIAALADTAPVVVVLDDLHCADVASLRLVQFLAPEVRSRRVVLVAGFRDSETGAESDVLSETLAALSREPGTERLVLTGLDEGEVGRVIADAAGATPDDHVVETVHRRTGGNPFFVTELTRWLAAGGSLDAVEHELPAGIRDVVRRRLDRLGTEVPAILSAAAVTGREFDLAVVSRVAGVDELDAIDLLERALAARLVEETPVLGRYRFAHALVRETLLSDMSAVRRVRTHARIAQVLEELGGASDDRWLPELAFHALEGAAAGEATAALQHALRASGQALRRLAFEDSGRLAERALQLLAATQLDDDRLRFELELLLGRARSRAADEAGARAALLEALTTARRLDDAELFARAALSFSGGAWWGWWTNIGVADHESIAVLEEALDRLGTEPSTRRATLLGRLAVELYFVPGADDRRDDLSAEALAMARELGDERCLVQVLALRHVAVWRPGNERERRVIADELVATARRARATELEILGHHVLGIAALERGDRAAMDAQVDVTERLAEELGAPVLASHAAWGRSMRALMAGDLTEAERMIEENLATSSRWSEGEAFRTYVAQLTVLRWEQGRSADLVEPLRKVVATEAVQPAWQVALAMMLADHGELDEARAVFAEVAGERFTDVPRDMRWLFNMASRSETAVLLEDAECAQAALDLLQPFVGTHIVFYTRRLYGGPVSYHVGALLSVLGRLDEAEERLSAGIEEAERVGAGCYRVRAQVRLGRVLLERAAPGDVDRAMPMLKTALQSAREMGMASLASRAEALLS